MIEEKEKPQLREGVRLKMVQMWADRYIKKFDKEGFDAAYGWACSFFNPADVSAIVFYANEIRKRKSK